LQYTKVKLNPFFLNGCETWFHALKEEHNTNVGVGKYNGTAHGTV